MSGAEAAAAPATAHPPDEGPPALGLEAASFRYPGAAEPAVDGLSLRVRAGEILALVGPNGAGKSTALRLAAGLLEPDSGRALLEGEPAAGLEPRARARRLAFLSQAERLPFAFRVLDFVLLGRAPRIPGLRGPGPGDVEAARAAIDRVGATAIAGKPVVELSAGEAQLARLARVLAQDAKVLVLDEPTATLDPARALGARLLFRALADEGRCLLVAVHDLAFARAAADRALALRGGRAVAEGAPGEVLVPAILEAAYGVPFREASVPVPDPGRG